MIFLPQIQGCAKPYVLCFFFLQSVLDLSWSRQAGDVLYNRSFRPGLFLEQKWAEMKGIARKSIF